MKTVTVQQYPMTLEPEVYHGVKSYGDSSLGEYTYLMVSGAYPSSNIPYEVYIPLSNIVHIRVEG